MAWLARSCSDPHLPTAVPTPPVPERTPPLASLATGRVALGGRPPVPHVQRRGLCDDGLDRPVRGVPGGRGGLRSQVRAGGLRCRRGGVSGRVAAVVRLGGFRFRRSTGDERLQLKWFVTAAAFVAVTFILRFFTRHGSRVLLDPLRSPSCTSRSARDPEVPALRHRRPHQQGGRLRRAGGVHHRRVRAPRGGGRRFIGATEGLRCLPPRSSPWPSSRSGSGPSASPTASSTASGRRRTRSSRNSPSAWRDLRGRGRAPQDGPDARRGHRRVRPRCGCEWDPELRPAASWPRRGGARSPDASAATRSPSSPTPSVAAGSASGRAARRAHAHQTTQRASLAGRGEAARRSRFPSGTGAAKLPALGPSGVAPAAGRGPGRGAAAP